MAFPACPSGPGLLSRVPLWAVVSFRGAVSRFKTDPLLADPESVCRCGRICLSPPETWTKKASMVLNERTSHTVAFTLPLLQLSLLSSFHHTLS